MSQAKATSGAGQVLSRLILGMSPSRAAGVGLALALGSASAVRAEPRWVEALDRGVVAVPAQGGGVLVSWRRLGDEPALAGFDVFRGSKKLNRRPILETSNFVDAGGDNSAVYSVRPSRGWEDLASGQAKVWEQGFLSVPIEQPPPGVTPAVEVYSYTANEASVGDLDGDGRYEIVLKWNPTNTKDNAFGGYSGPVILDAYPLEGRRLWRIDLGRNIRAGSHYTQFQVFDFDGDGRAELAVRTSDGTVDGLGRVLGDPKADWRETGGEAPQADKTGALIKADGTKVAAMQGRIVRGPEYLTVFDGLTGAALASAPYSPQRGAGTNDPTPAQMEALWGDGYGNRVDRFLAGTAYLDGRRPSIIMARGYYARSVIAAWDWRDGKLTQRWLFDSAAPGNGAFGGQGNHQLSVADVDGDGRDEIVYGSMAVDDDGKGLWSSGLRHGDAMHVGDLDPMRPGLEKFGVHEEVGRNGGVGSAMLDARTGEILWSRPADKDVGRGVAADIDPRYPGQEVWGTNLDALLTAKGQAIAGTRRPREASFTVWWDGDELRELFHDATITKWDWKAGTSRPILQTTGVVASNGTKNTPVVSADLLGDWREEIVLRTQDERALRIYATPYPTRRGLVTLMHDPQYRVAIAWQNTAYNQPPQTSFYIGADMAPPKPVPVLVRKPSK